MQREVGEEILLEMTELQVFLTFSTLAIVNYISLKPYDKLLKGLLVLHISLHCNLAQRVLTYVSCKLKRDLHSPKATYLLSCLHSNLNITDSPVILLFIYLVVTHLLPITSLNGSLLQLFVHPTSQRSATQTHVAIRYFNILPLIAGHVISRVYILTLTHSLIGLSKNSDYLGHLNLTRTPKPRN